MDAPERFFPNACHFCGMSVGAPGARAERRGTGIRRNDRGSRVGSGFRGNAKRLFGNEGRALSGIEPKNSFGADDGRPSQLTGNDGLAACHSPGPSPRRKEFQGQGFTQYEERPV